MDTIKIISELCEIITQQNQIIYELAMLDGAAECEALASRIETQKERYRETVGLDGPTTKGGRI